MTKTPYDGSEIAIVGMACRLPGADDPESFWRNLVEGVESIRRLSDEELLAAGVDPAELRDPHALIHRMEEAIGPMLAQRFQLAGPLQHACRDRIRQDLSLALRMAIIHGSSETLLPINLHRRTDLVNSKARFEARPTHPAGLASRRSVDTENQDMAGTTGSHTQNPERRMPHAPRGARRR